MIYYNQKNKKCFKFKRIVILISVLIVLPIFFSSIQGDIAFFANNSNRKENFDTDSLRDSSVYYADTTGEAWSVYVSGDYAYVADYYSGLAVIDISDPTNPGTPDYMDTTGEAHGVYVSGDCAYVATGFSGLAVIDISDPTNPGTPVYENTDGYAYKVYVSGDYAYIADEDSGLAVIDISDPTNPGTPVYEDTTGWACDVYVSGDYAYVADWYSGLAVIDISDPTNPGTPVYEDTTGWAYGVYVSGDYAYVADYTSGLAVIDISDPTNPGTPVYRDTTGYAYGVYVSGDYAYVADRYLGLAAIDISDPTNPGTPVYEDTTGAAIDVYVSGNYAYVGDYDSGLAVIEISEPIDPGTPVYEDTTGIAIDVYLSGDYAYMATHASGLAVIDISDPTNPGTPVYEDTIGGANGVYVSGDYVYMADTSKGLAVIDISDPTNPGTPVYENTAGWARGVYVSGDYAYVADGSSGLAVIDISDPTNPGTPVYEDTTGDARGVYVSGDYAYVADYTSGLAVIDISDPTKPGNPVYEDTTGSAYDIYVSGDYAYVADGTSGLAVIDISSPIKPGKPIYYEDTTGEAHGVYVSGDYAYVADYGSGLAVIDISDPTNPGSPVYEDTTGESRDIYVSGDYAYLADVGSGLAVIQIRKRFDMEAPIITTAPSDFTVEVGYTGQSLSWTATDANPDTYTIELQGTGIVAGPTTWTSGNAINYNIPNGFGVGAYIYTVTFTDDYDHFITDSVTFTVDDTTNPTITNAPSDLTVEFGYTGQSISWTATDANPDTYTIELEGSGLVAGPTTWTSGNAITYNIPDGYGVGSYIYTVKFTDDYDHFITDSVTFTVDDTTHPTITNAPSDFTVEAGYTEQSISWTATDSNPNTYTIKLQGSGLVAGPTTWTSGDAISYNIPDGYGVGSYFYTVKFTDDYDHFITDSVTFTVDDTTHPTITNAPSDFTVEAGYTGQSISWTATDSNPNTYTIELQGSGIIAGPTTWTNGDAISYNIPDGYGVGSYIYTINFTDDYSNSIINSVTFTVDDTTHPTITNNPSDLTVEFGYTGQSISWTATDSNPNTYTIELQGSGIVSGPTAWTSGVAITYNIPDGYSVGSYIYAVNFTDNYNNFITDSVTFTVSDTTNPIITNAPSDLTVDFGYAGRCISWTATDLNPNTYTIELEGSGIVSGPSAWSSATTILYNIPDGFAVGVYVYTVNFTDDYGNFITDSVTFTVEDTEDTTNPVIIGRTANFTVEAGYTGKSILWQAYDANPNTYEIELQGSGRVAGPTMWFNGVAITYNVPDSLAASDYFYTVTFIDDTGNFVKDTVKITVKEEPPVADDPQIPFGNWYLIFLGISITALVLIQKRRK